MGTCLNCGVELAGRFCGQDGKLVRTIAPRHRAGARLRARAVLPRPPFPEHLHFAVLFQSFVFLVLALESVTAFFGTLVALGAGQVVQAVVIAWYGVVAQRRVYGGSWPMAVLKGLGVGAVYFVVWSAAVLSVAVWVS